MENKERSRSVGYNSRALLLLILAGFAILAVIEIIYGQRRIRLERERLALEEQNRQQVQQIEQEESPVKESSDAAADGAANHAIVNKDTVIVQENTVEKTASSGQTDSAAVSANSVSANSISANDMQIVFLGDSIIDSDRDHENVATLIGEACNARVYNMAMGGTTGALLPGERYDYNHWESRGMLGVVNAIVGNIGPEIFEGYAAGEILKTCDFSRTDYFVLEYGTNDCLSGQIPQSIYLPNGDTLTSIDRNHTFAGALATAISLLQTNFPDARIMLITPTYCEIFHGETFMGDAYSLDCGYGKMIDFANCTIYAYEQNKDKNVLLYNAFNDSGIKATTADWYLEDGVHLTAEGRRVYAECAARILNSDFRPVE